MNLRFWKRDRHDSRDRQEPSGDLREWTGGGFGAATGRTGSFGNMGGGGSDVPEEGDAAPLPPNGKIGSSTSGRH